MVTKAHLIGFDDIFNEFFRTTEKTLKVPSYPPYSIYKKEGKVYLEFAVAGFSQDELEVTLENDILRVNGIKPNDRQYDENSVSPSEPNYIYRGIATRNFSLEFRINPRLEIEDASLDLGILKIVLKDTGYRSQKISIKTESTKDSRQLLTE